MKMKYQLEYDKVLLAKDRIILEEIGEIISSVSIWIRFGKVFDGDISCPEHMILVDGEEKYLSELLRVAYDPKTKEFSFYPHDAIGDNYEVVDYTKDVGEVFVEPQPISKKEFFSIIEKYGHLFEMDNSLQNCAYSSYKIESKL
ncbi:hypothetical protein TQ94_19910 [Bacillus cereus]|uniref:Uncharacterized protein n=2 Tax=Bacillus cereus TaxID=1396 RepID=A0A9X0KEQ2_BACCE|nr:hypothetical protein TQ94_19910 [Bacillus cereus]